MTQDIGDEIDRYEIGQFLKDRGLGVLGLAKSGEAYTIPIAFAYDDDKDRCIFRFVMTDNSLKRQFLSETESASLTAYEWRSPDDWKSVVARGPLHEVPGEDLAEAAALFSDVGKETALEIFNEPISEYETLWYELEIAEITGRAHFPGVKDRSD